MQERKGKMEKRYKLVITDNATSEVLNEFDTDCIIAGVSTGENEAVSASIAHCGSATIAATLATAVKAVKKTIEHDPTAGLLLQFIMEAEEKDISGGDDDE